jgi:hypothetical protein
MAGGLLSSALQSSWLSVHAHADAAEEYGLLGSTEWVEQVRSSACRRRRRRLARLRAPGVAVAVLTAADATWTLAAGWLRVAAVRVEIMGSIMIRPD